MPVTGLMVEGAVSCHLERTGLPLGWPACHTNGEWPQISDRLGEIFCLTFIRNSDDADALRRMGALSDAVGQRTLGDLTEEAQEFDQGYPTVAAAARLDGWTVMIEPGGF